MMGLSLVAVPYRYDELHDGLGLGPGALLDGGLVVALRQAGVEVSDPVEVRLPEDERIDGPIAANIGRLGAHVGRHVSEACEGEGRVLVLAGDDTTSVGVIAGLQLAHGAGHRIGIVWFDAHGDFNTPETSVSNILAGMPLAILAGLAGPLWRESAMLAATVPTDRMVIAGVRELDDAEEQLLRSTDVQILRHAESLSGWTFADAMSRLAEKVDEIYVHIDLDVLDPSLVPSSSTPSPRGMTLANMEKLLDQAFATGKVAVVGLAGLNPRAGQRGETSTASAKALLLAVIPRWMGIERSERT
ncbi:MAG: arginase family protein [Chloroflexia bacterium]|nr:arginase family protein [Chloroflexia bacterium]